MTGTAPAILLEAQGLSKSFGGIKAVSDFSFVLYENEILGLIGPNGAGKSTTFNLISGFFRPQSGRLIIGGRDIRGKSPAAISRLGLVRTFQHDSCMHDMTVRDNILIGTLRCLRRRHERDRRIAETAEFLGLSAYLDEVARNLPHGLQRLLSIGIAFASRPKILCLDEPLTGLNGAELARALDVVSRIKTEFGSSVLFVDHNAKAVMRLCDRILVLNYGQLLAAGTPEEIKGNPRVIEAYLGAAA